MGGRVKRMAGLVAAAAQASEDIACALCSRPLGHCVEHHHIVPKSKGGAQTVPLHPICHRTIHVFVTNRDLATAYPTMTQLRVRDDVQRYLKWIANKPSDARVLTRRRNASDASSRC
jgi:hypothetical protein